jgi:hypothetical protein
MALSGPAYRCNSAGGGVAFQDQPCEDARAERPFDMPAFPPQNTLERDRLLQREAALDARMLKRAEIDASERIAREARWAREAELEAERERARAAASQYYPIYPVYGHSVRPRPAYRPASSQLIR